MPHDGSTPAYDITTTTIALLRQVVTGTTTTASTNAGAYPTLKMGLRALQGDVEALAAQAGTDGPGLRKALTAAFGEARTMILLMPASMQGKRTDLEETSGPGGPKLGRTEKRIRRIARALAGEQKAHAWELLDWIDEHGSWKQAETIITSSPEKVTEFFAALKTTGSPKALFTGLFSVKRDRRTEAKKLYEKAGKLMAQARALVGDVEIQKIVAELNTTAKPQPAEPKQLEASEPADASDVEVEVDEDDEPVNDNQTIDPDDDEDATGIRIAMVRAALAAKDNEVSYVALVEQLGTDAETIKTACRSLGSAAWCKLYDATKPKPTSGGITLMNVEEAKSWLETIADQA